MAWEVSGPAWTGYRESPSANGCILHSRGNAQPRAWPSWRKTGQASRAAHLRQPYLNGAKQKRQLPLLGPAAGTERRSRVIQ